MREGKSIASDSRRDGSVRSRLVGLLPAARRSREMFFLSARLPAIVSGTLPDVGDSQYFASATRITLHKAVAQKARGVGRPRIEIKVRI